MEFIHVSLPGSRLLPSSRSELLPAECCCMGRTLGLCSDSCRNIQSWDPRVRKGRRRHPAGNYQHGQELGKGPCSVWSGGEQEESGNIPELLEVQLQSCWSRALLPIRQLTNQGVTQCSLQGSDQVLGNPLCHRAGAALGGYPERSGISFLCGF